MWSEYLKFFWQIIHRPVFFYYKTKNNDILEKNLSFLVISSNKIKGNLKKNDTLLSNIEEILKVGNNESDKNFNSNNLQIYEKTLFICVSPNLDNFKVTYDTLNLSTSVQRSVGIENRSKSSKIILWGVFF